METVISNDGTRIAFERVGSGPPLLLVHGTAGAGDRWAPIVPALAPEFTVYTMDRRGRGGSSDASDYAIEREFEDVAAVVDALDEPANVLGHSYGGTCALEASLLTDNINKLILYEPDATPPDVPYESDGLADKLERLLDTGGREAVVVAFMQELVGMSDQEIQSYRESPPWPSRVAAAQTLPRELDGAERYRCHAERFAEMRVPTMLLTGGDSPPLFTAGVKFLDEVLPDSHIVVMPGSSTSPTSRLRTSSFARCSASSEGIDRRLARQVVAASAASCSQSRGRRRPLRMPSRAVVRDLRAGPPERTNKASS